MSRALPTVYLVRSRWEGYGEALLLVLLWQLTRKCEYISSGLRRAGFEGGWL